MIELYQAEWCPHSRKVRHVLTELNVDFVARQVAPEPDDRDTLRAATGQESVPAIVLDDGTVLTGEDDDIIAALRERFPPGPWEEEHRERRLAHQS